jgi:A/G-specific adenine glycosylase
MRISQCGQTRSDLGSVGVKLSIEAVHVPSRGDASNLVAWYEVNHRQLPWRATNDPYAIWVSETMLQQTRVETVIPYYHSFMENYPTVLDLANAGFEEVSKLWQGLGYYSRARNLLRAAQVIVSQFGGNMPKSEAEIRSLPGIGSYTAGAVLSIAFNQPVPAVDGNVLRVMARFLAVPEPIELSSVKQRITDQVQEWLYQTRPSSLTQALMELGATVCTPRNAKCSDCPIQENCAAYARGIQLQLPVRKPKQAKKNVYVYALWCEQDGYVLMHRRSVQGLLAGMWELPGIECPADEATADASKSGSQPRKFKRIKATRTSHASSDQGIHDEILGVRERRAAEALEALQGTVHFAACVVEADGHKTEQMATDGEPAAALPRLDSKESLRQAVLIRERPEQPLSFVPIAEERHVFTHINWRVEVLRPVGLQFNLNQLPAADEGGGEYRWVERTELHKLFLPRVYEKLIEAVSTKYSLAENELAN